MLLKRKNKTDKKSQTARYWPYCRAILLLVLFGWVMTGCGASSPYYKNAEGRPDSKLAMWEQKKPVFSLFFIGDTGSPSSDPLDPNLRTLQNHLKSAGKNSAVVFLGDNIYGHGLRPVNHPKRKKSERRIDTQLKILEDYQGRPIFIPGNHDWNNDRPGGWEAIRRQQKYIENRLGPAAFTPDNGCPGPVEVRLDSANILLVIDTEWWLYPHKKPGSGQCANGSEEQFIRVTDSLIAHHKKQNIFVAGHHPLYSNGPHNGYFPAIDHLFPLLKYSSKLYVPLPIIGSINPLYRKFVGYRQDLAGKQYRRLQEKLTQTFQQHPNLAYAAGHDHSLQYHHIKKQHYIVNGAGTVDSYVRKGKSANFAYSQNGFARIDVYPGSTILSFWIPDRNIDKGIFVYQKKLY